MAVSESIRKDLIENFGMPAERVVVIPNAVDETEIAKMSVEPVICPWAADIPVVITAGRLSPEKGQAYLIRAFAEVRKTMACQLAILGTGELDDPLKRLASELGVATDVHFPGLAAESIQVPREGDGLRLAIPDGRLRLGAARSDGMQRSRHRHRLPRRPA